MDPCASFVKKIYTSLLAQSRVPLKHRLGRAMMLLSESGTGADSVVVKDLPFPPTLFGAALDNACLHFASEMGVRIAQKPGLYHFRMLTALGRLVGTMQMHTHAHRENGNQSAQKRMVLDEKGRIVCGQEVVKIAQPEPTGIPGWMKRQAVKLGLS